MATYVCVCVTTTREERKIIPQSSVISKTTLHLAHTETYTHKSYLNIAWHFCHYFLIYFGILVCLLSVRLPWLVSHVTVFSLCAPLVFTFHSEHSSIIIINFTCVFLTYSSVLFLADWLIVFESIVWLPHCDNPKINYSHHMPKPNLTLSNCTLT